MKTMFKCGMMLSCMQLMLSCESTEVNGVDQSDTLAKDSTQIQDTIPENDWRSETGQGGPDSVGFDMVLYDFQPSHPDFENFDSRREFHATMPDERKCGGRAGDTLLISETNLKVASKYFGVSADPSLVGTPMMYGDYGEEWGANTWNLQHHTEDAKGEFQTWGEAVVASPGMVEPVLAYETEGDYFSTYPIQREDRCDASDFASWFVESPGINLEVKDVIWWKKDTSVAGTAPFYYYDSRENGGFFPLNKYADGSKPTFGKQNLNIWCPPPWMRNPSFKDYEAPVGEEELCNEYWGAFNSETGLSSFNPEHPRMVNGNFTGKMYIEVGYYADAEFYIQGSGDIWVFVDDELVVDLGGVSHPKEALIEFKKLADLKGWVEGSRHILHLFVTQRQSPYSHLVIKTNAIY